MIRKFQPYLRAHRWQVAFALGQVFLVAGFELLKPWPLQIVIDYVLGSKTPPVGGLIGGGPIGDFLSLPKGPLLLLACIGNGPFGNDKKSPIGPPPIRPPTGG